jgi:carboxylesterase
VLAKLAPFIGKLIPVVPAKMAGLVANDIAKGGDERAYAHVPPAAGNSLLAELPRVKEALGRVTCPALVAYSAQDHSVPPDNSLAVLRLLGSADKTELRLERSYHVATLDHDAPLLEEKIAAFADRVAAPRA